jgi:PhnB protein
MLGFVYVVHKLRTDRWTFRYFALLPALPRVNAGGRQFFKGKIMPQLNAYLGFGGNCAEAMRFYERVLGGKIEMMMTNGESPMRHQMPPGNEDRVMHARMVIDKDVIMAGDAMVGCEPYQGMKGFSLTLSYASAAEAKPVFEALSEGGKITMPLQKTFWAESFGMLTDRFGTPWIINGGLIDVKPAG